MAVGIGVNGILKINTGTDASPTYTLIGGQRNAKVNMNNKTVDITTKGNFGWADSLNTVRDISIEVDGLVDELDAGFLALEQMFWSPPAAGKKFQFLTPGGRTVTGSFMLDGIPEDFPYADAVGYKASIKSKGVIVLA